MRSYFSSTRPRDATSNNGHRKIKKTLRSNDKTKLDPFGNVVNLSDNLFSRREFSYKFSYKFLNFCPWSNKYSKQNRNKDLLKFYRNIKLRHTLDQLKIIQINLDLKAIVIGYQINYPAVLKLS